VYLTLFGDGDKTTDTETASTDQAGELTQATSDGAGKKRAGQTSTCWPYTSNRSGVGRRSLRGPWLINSTDFFRSVLELETHESEVIDPGVADRLTTVLSVEELREEDVI